MSHMPITASPFWTYVFIGISYTAALGCLSHAVRMGALEYAVAKQLKHPRVARISAAASPALFFLGFVVVLWAIESWAHFRTPFYVYDESFERDMIPRIPFAAFMPASWAPVPHKCSDLVLQLMCAHRVFTRIPLSVLLLEASLVYSAMWAAILLGTGFRLAPFLAGLIVVNVDAILDPVVAASHSCNGALSEAAPRLGLWHWYQGASPQDAEGIAQWFGVPLFNYGAWWAGAVILVSFVLLVQYMRKRVWARMRRRAWARIDAKEWTSSDEYSKFIPTGRDVAIVGPAGAIVLGVFVAVSTAPNLSPGAIYQWAILGSALLVTAWWLGIRVRKRDLEKNPGRLDGCVARPLLFFILLGVAALCFRGIFLAIPTLMFVAVFCLVVGALLAWWPYPGEIQGFVQRLLDLDRFVRLHYLGFAFLLVLLGSFSLGLQIRDPNVYPPEYTLLLNRWQIGGLLAIALFYHVWGFVLNDVIDLPVDRTQVRRRNDPLVQGRIDRIYALALALLSVPSAFLVAFLLGVPLDAYLVLLVGMLLMALYNVRGKRLAVPIVTDLVQAAAWGCLAIFAAMAVEPSVAAQHPFSPSHWLLTWAIAGYGAGFILLINGIHGGLRDLANDIACGARTTAILLGARVDEKTGEAVSNRLIALFAFAVHLAMFVMPSWVLFSDLELGENRTPVMALLYGLGLVSLAMLWLVVKPREPKRDLWIGRHLPVLLLPAAVPFLPFLDATSRCLLVTAFVVPLLVQEGVVVRVLRWIHPEIAEAAVRPPGGQPQVGATGSIPVAP
jgi:4-hydroxybenzoate polyprenyltransferase